MVQSRFTRFKEKARPSSTGSRAGPSRNSWNRQSILESAMLNSTSTGFLLVTSTVVLIASLFLTNDPVDMCAVSGGMQYCVGWNNAYAFVWSIMEIVLCAVGLAALKYKPDLLSKVLVAKAPMLYAPVTVESLLSFVLFLNATIGALIMTNQPEHGFDQTNNGYFACWAGVCAALGNIGVDAIKNGEDIAKKGVSPAWGIIISSIMVLRTNAPRLELAAPCQRRPAPC